MLDMLNNIGSAALEATLVLPLFLFGMVGLYSFCQIKLTENIAYEAANETAEYLAEMAYLTVGNSLTAQSKFNGYVDDKELIKKYIKGGSSGVSFLGSNYLDHSGNVHLKVAYTLKTDIPFISNLVSRRVIELDQKAYLGNKNSKATKIPLEDTYVYVTDNKDVYHVKRRCSHLALSIRRVYGDESDLVGYRPCSFCGRGSGDYVYVTNEGESYHFDLGCLGLKRTVHCVKLSEVADLPVCSRCGGRLNGK